MQKKKWAFPLFCVLLATNILSISSSRSGLTKVKPVTSNIQHQWKTVDGKPIPFKSYEEVEDFLLQAKVLSTEQVGFGIAQTKKVVLEKDGIRMHSAFRTVKKDIYIPNRLQTTFLQNHRDDYRFEVAAYKLSRLLGMDLVPPTVLRKIKGKKGSLQAWVEECMMETQRRERKCHPPDEWQWIAQMLTMHLWDNLVGNRDRNQGNLLIGSGWEIWLIDHTQAFRRYRDLHSVEKLLYCDHTIWRNLQKLDDETIKTELAQYLRKPELDALKERRDLVINQIQGLIDQKGEFEVLF